jgi:nucleoside 2-deoxyribosyltransferase
MRPGVPSVFLAGSIDEGRAEKWQDETIAVLSACPITILNPRRDDWNPNLRQSEDEPEFVAQVDWELDGIEAADVVLFHFSPAGPAPITLLELGKATGMGKRIVVSCPEGYWRRGNVQVVCRRAGVRVHGSLHDAIAELLAIMPAIAAAKEACP